MLGKRRGYYFDGSKPKLIRSKGLGVLGNVSAGVLLKLD